MPKHPLNPVKVDYDEEKDEIVIRMKPDNENKYESSSGKTFIVASTHGFTPVPNSTMLLTATVLLKKPKA